MRWAFRPTLVLIASLGLAAPAGTPVAPLTVCQVIRDLPALQGKDVAVVGRYTFRATGRWIGEQACDPASALLPQLWLEEDANTGPKPEGPMELDAAALKRAYADILKRTSLGKFKFGSADYDRWAVVYGRIEVRPGSEPSATRPTVVFRGSGTLFFISPED
jgi:hypothetical protein